MTDIESLQIQVEAFEQEIYDLEDDRAALEAEIDYLRDQLEVSGSVTLEDLGQQIWDTCEEKGFHDPISPEIGEIAVRLLLTISEICEAFEAVRKDDPDHHREEIADTFIRLLHYAAHEKIDADTEVGRKMEINRGRPYKHGKRF